MLYDGQCEICQACVSWVKTIDRHNLTVCLPINAEVLPEVDSRLRLDECLRELHVVTPQGEIYVGWDAVTCLARRFPSTSVIGVVGQWFPFRQIGRLLYGFVARNRYSLSKCRGGACSVAKPEQVRRQANLGAFWSCYTVGFFLRLPLVAWAGIKAAVQRTSVFARTYHKRLDLLDGKLTVLFLDGNGPQRNSIAVWRIIHHGFVRRNRNRSRLAQDATVVGAASSSDETEYLENCCYPCSRGTRGQS